MRTLICIDDTDDLESKGTGELAEMISQAIEERAWGKCYGITRHQLLVHSDIPYTSHNSSMCFVADLNENSLDLLINFASDFLSRECAKESDPGLCVAIPERIADKSALISFGREAKVSVLKKQDAYDLAGRLGLHLSEHGGTGQGVIGALAGAGLRLSGNDGRFKGKFKINSPNGIITAGEALSHPKIDLVKSLDGDVLDNEELIKIDDTLKTVLLNGKSVLLVYSGDQSNEGIKWHSCTKQQLKKF